MARSRTFGAPRESVVVRIQATRDGKIIGTQSYRVIGATLDGVCSTIENALEVEFGGGPAENEDADEEEEQKPAASVDGPPGDQFSFDDLLARVRRIDSKHPFLECMREVRGLVPAPSRKHIGALTGRSVMDFQNWLYDENAKWHLTDLQLLALMRAEFPLNTGQVFTGDIETGLGHIQSIRADYNRTGHGGLPPAARGLPVSTSYERR